MKVTRWIQRLKQEKVRSEVENEKRGMNEDGWVNNSPGHNDLKSSYTSFLIHYQCTSTNTLCCDSCIIQVTHVGWELCDRLMTAVHTLHSFGAWTVRWGSIRPAQATLMEAAEENTSKKTGPSLPSSGSPYKSSRHTQIAQGNDVQDAAAVCGYAPLKSQLSKWLWTYPACFHM